jgi:DNA polymerase-3 subunit alpha
VTNVQYKTAKNGKDWAMFTLEGYDESHEFRIFDEEYLKFRHFLVNNQFVYFKVTVKDGWVNRETGKKSDPRIQFMDVKQLQDVLPQFAKKLSIQMDIHELQMEFIQQLNQLFTANKGDHTVTFEVMEFEKVLKPVEPLPKVVVDEELIAETDNPEEMLVDLPVVEEQVQIATRVSLPSRKLKIRISNELLTELEKMNVKFSLN